MQYLLILVVLIAAGVGALFVIKDNNPLFIGTLVIVIVGFIFGVSRIAAEKEKQ